MDITASERMDTETSAGGNEEAQSGAHGEPVAPQPAQPTTDDAAAAESAARAVVEARAIIKREAEILKSAGEIRDRRAWGRMNPWDPRRGQPRSHWDHVLEEMTWMAKEFQRERRWKLLQARKAANAAQRSNLDLESRVTVRAKEEEKALRKRASWIAREVAAFWVKAHRVVAFKIRTELEAKKKEVLDRQLDALLGQTQRYSSLLAKRLAVDERVEAITAASKAEPEAASLHIMTQHKAGEGLEIGSQKERDSVPATSEALPESGAVSGNVHTDDDAKDYRSGEDDDADDEGTLEEEEALAAAEGINIKEEQEKEAAGLADDADVPLEELLARYGYVILSLENDVATREAGAPLSEDEAPGPSWKPATAFKDHSDAESERLDALLRDMGPPPQSTLENRASSRLAAEFAELSDEEGPTESDQMETRKTRGAKSSSKLPVKAAAVEDEDEYRSGEDDDADDEATLEEEERLAAAEGLNIKEEEKQEAVGLADDAELPIEELLARYGYLMPSPSGGEGEGEVDEEALQNVKAEPRDEETLPQQPSKFADKGNAVDVDETGAAADDRDFTGTMQAMAAAQPTGFTLATTKVKTPVPFLLKGQLREYQHIGLDWLVTLYHRRLNGILADEMGLGKTIQTIALLAWLAAERGDWGPHLIVVPTSVMLNWEMEFKRWCPAFKLLTYYGSPKDRAAKRQGWSKPNAFHVCITSYTLMLQDARIFRRKKWKYLILDEAHMIKNWRSQRWQTLLNFNSKRRLLITGTPLQNDLMELWSLMHFLMPEVFASHAQFKDWFSNPLNGMVEGSAEYNRAIIDRLHAVLRPFLLRRMKKDVEKQLPGKHEHVVRCRLSKRQRALYEEYMASGDTRATLASGNFLGIMNCLMQLRKVCNHPDLFEGRPIISAFDAPPLEIRVPSVVVDALSRCGGAGDVFKNVAHDLFDLGLTPVEDAVENPAWALQEAAALALRSETFQQPHTTPQEDIELLWRTPQPMGSLLAGLHRTPSHAALTISNAAVHALVAQRRAWRADRTAALGRLSESRLSRRPSLTADVVDAACISLRVARIHTAAEKASGRHLDCSSVIADMVKLPDRRAEEMDDLLKSFVFVIPKARAPPPALWCSHPDASEIASAAIRARSLQSVYASSGGLLHVPRLRTQLFFPDKRLLQYDCGKLQELALLLARLRAGGHRALIFTQMSRMLDILESFLNLHAYTYVRLDGATKPEARQTLMQRFNTDPRIFCFILSTRSGGVGMNLTGADTVIFYDSDWNPAMDAQAQDRCHRIGQTREVHIYRLVSEHTIEENILKKSDQKRQLDWLAIQSGGFTTDILTKFDPTSLLEGAGAGEPLEGREKLREAMQAAEDEGDAAAAAAAEREVAAELDEFTKEPPPPTEAGDGGEDGTEPGGIKTTSEAGDEEGGQQMIAGPSLPTAEEADADDGLTALTVGGSDTLAALESTLRPVERYAVRFVEFETPSVDPDAVAAQIEATYKVDEFDVNAIEAAEEEREAEIDEDEEANIVADWDQEAATKAYAEQVEAAEREQEAAEAAWWAQYGMAVSLEPSSTLLGAGGSGGGGWAAVTDKSIGGVGRPRGRGRKSAVSGEGGFEDTALSSGAQVLGENGLPSAKRRRTAFTEMLQPWEPQEDLVLCSVVAMLLDGGVQQPSLWSIASDALAAGAAASALTGIETAASQGRQRGPVICERRYSQLETAFAAASGDGISEAMMKSAEVDRIRSLIKDALRNVTPGSADSEALASIYHVLSRRSEGQHGMMDGQAGKPLIRRLDDLRAQAHGELQHPPVSAPPLGPIPRGRASALADAIRRGCGSGAARVIGARLPAIVEAAKAGACAFGFEATEGLRESLA